MIMNSPPMAKFTNKGNSMAYENFKRIVPTELQEKIKQLADLVEFREIITGHQESMTEETIYPIEGNYRSGWMPNQDGGYSIDQFYRSDEDSTYHFTEKQTEWMDRYYDDMLESFCRDNDIENPDCIDYDSLQMVEQLSEYEFEWFEPSLLQFQVFAEREDKFNDESPFNVVCRLSINYKDAPYYREKYAEDLKVISYTMDEFMQTENRVIVAEFKI